jgi:hypothetical protein
MPAGLRHAQRWLLINRHSAHNADHVTFVDCRQPLPYLITEGLPVTRDLYAIGDRADYSYRRDASVNAQKCSA